MDPNLKFAQQISGVIKSSFFYLRQLGKVKLILSRDHSETMIHAFVITRLNYCNALYAGLSENALSQLQVIPNAAARLLTGTWKHEHISLVLASLHWLPVCFRVV